MAKFVSAGWLADRLDSPALLLLDARRPMRYLQGHLPNAVSLPAAKLIDADGRLMPEDRLAGILGATGVAEATELVVYDGYDGRNAAMVVWVLEYLGATNVSVLDVFYERWAADGREIRYKPVTREHAVFTPSLRPRLRATAAGIRDGGDAKLIDFRSAAEYRGELEGNTTPGHLPGAVNLVWQDLVGGKTDPMFDRAHVERGLRSAGIGKGERLIAYCQMGPRAALGWLLVSQLGHKTSLYDGSYLDWVQQGLPIER